MERENLRYKGAVSLETYEGKPRMIRPRSSRHPGAVFWTLLVPLLAAGSVRAQAPAAQPQSPESGTFQELVQRLRVGMADPRYSGLNDLEQRAVGVLALSEIELVASGECTDPSAVEKASVRIRYQFAHASRDVLKPVMGLPDSRKDVLIDTAMALAAKEDSNSEITNITCHRKLLPASSVYPIEARRGGARHVLSIELGLEKAGRPLPRAP